MPITLTPAPPANALGPGLLFTLQSGFIGPLPTGSTWTLLLFADTTSEVQFQTQVFESQSNPTHQFLQLPGSQTTFAQGQPTAQATIGWEALLENAQSTVLDQGTGSVKWDPTLGLGTQIQNIQTGTSTGGGLTDAQAVELSQTQASTFPTLLVDQLLLQELSNGPTSGPVNASLVHFSFGVIVRISHVPPDLVADTPDGDYWFPSLAVVRVFRGADLWLRVPVHTSSKMIPFSEQNVVAGLAQVTGTLWLLNMSVQVTFRTGVQGQVFNMLFP